MKRSLFKLKEVMASVLALPRATTSYLSPSGRFKLVLIRGTQYPWPISRISIGRADIAGGPTNWLPLPKEEICSQFRYQFFNQGGREWLWYRIEYAPEHFMNLDTGQIYTSPALNQFHWNEVHFNPGGTLAAVRGSFVEEPYEFRFYDLREIAKGWPEIGIEPCPYHDSLYFYDNVIDRWLDETRFQLEQFQAWSMLFDRAWDTLTELQIDAERQREEDLEREAEKRGEEVDDDLIYPEKILYRAVLRCEMPEVFAPLGVGDQTISTAKMVYEVLEPSPIYLAQIDPAKRRTFDQNFPNNTRYQALKGAFPNSSVYFFDYKGKSRDLDSPIEAVHFGLTVLIGNDLYSIHSHPHETTVAPGTYKPWDMTKEVEKFETTADAISYLEAQRVQSITLQLTTSPWKS